MDVSRSPASLALFAFDTGDHNVDDYDDDVDDDDDDDLKDNNFIGNKDETCEEYDVDNEDDAEDDDDEDDEHDGDDGDDDDARSKRFRRSRERERREIVVSFFHFRIWTRTWAMCVNEEDEEDRRV